MAAKKRTIGEIIKSATPRRRTVTVYLAGDLAGQIEDLELQLQDHAGWVGSSMADSDPRRAIAQQIAELQEKIRDSAAEFTLQALPAKVHSDLLLQHPGRTSDELWNPVTLLPALVQASCVDPVMTVAEYEELSQVLNAGQRELLEGAAWRVNNEATTVPFSLAASALLSSTAEK